LIKKLKSNLADGSENLELRPFGQRTPFALKEEIKLSPTKKLILI